MLRFLCISTWKFARATSYCAISICPVVCRRAMSDLAAGKKAAAVKAVDDYVKVGGRFSGI